jgi:hypothetical protein
MRLDIRFPIGLLFIVLGAILVVYGPFAGQQVYEDHSLGINVNLWWGLVMLAFGIFMFVLGKRGTSAVQSSEQSPEGRRLEDVERLRDEEGESNRRGH